MDINQYLESVNKRFQSGISREHSYRGDLEALIRELVPDVNITNEPANVTDCGNPDYVIADGRKGAKSPLVLLKPKILAKI